MERYLRLAATAPQLLEIFRQGELTTEQMIALCATDSYERQVSVLCWPPVHRRRREAHPGVPAAAPRAAGHLDLLG